VSIRVIRGQNFLGFRVEQNEFADVSITDLRCEYLVDPLGIDERAPRLSWRLETDRRGARQIAYRVRVASSAEKLARGESDRWDSGRVESTQTTHIEFAGTPLRSREACHWDVEAWDETGASARSAAARWTMGLLEAGDWTARWIAGAARLTRPKLTEPGRPVLLRREFEVHGEIRRATLYATARGVFELRLNGARVGEDFFAPEWTDYRKRIHYRTYDVNAQIASGRNALAATLGDGWWSGFVGWQETRARYDSLENSLCVQLELEFASGERVVVASDRYWRGNTGPIQSADFHMGESYDARRERPGWDRAEFERAESWLAAREVAPPTARLVAQRSPPVRITETIVPRAVNEVPRGVFVYNPGQNLSGFVRLRLRGLRRGTCLTLRHGERLNPDGSLYTENLRRAKATDVYVARGDAEETWQPQFTFHGFQFFEISGLTLPLPPEDAVGCVLHSATPPAGRFECSHAGVNRLWLNGVWSQRDNFLSVPTDCPQRDERLGWMGDAQVFLRTASYNMDVAAFFTKWMIDVEDAQTPEGIFPDVAPRPPEDIRFVGLDQLCGAAGWADAGVIVPWTIWRVYGDRRILARHWDAMVKWLEWVERTNPRGIRENELGNNYGDWLCIPTDTSFRTHSPMKTLLATAYWADDAAKLARMARELGRAAEAERFQKMFERVREEFQREWLRDDGRLAVETQTAYLLALAFDLLPRDVRARAADRLVENIRALGWHLSTGFIGISHLNPQLTLAGRADVAYRLLLQDTFPSWLYPVKHGATTIWERWNGWTHDDGFFNPQMNSFNHYSLGSIGEWLFRHVAGIELDAEAAGFQRFVLRPFVGAGLDFARASFAAQHGTIESAWRRDGETLRWDVRVPPNTTATIFIPSEPETPVESAGLRILRRDGQFAIAEAPAGRYRFHSRLRGTPVVTDPAAT